ncbi:MAG: transcription-repair coupling factor [Rhodospirillales bacterium]|nr:transcription-repair coupling factor [Rhodospirillales bacterium]
MSALDDSLSAIDPPLPVLAPRQRLTISGAPEGHDAFVLGRLASRSGEVLHVCRDDGRMARLASALEFFYPGLEILTLPAWDCLPYDRVSPNTEIVSRRVDTLTRLADADEPSAGRIVLTTVNALLQRVPPREVFRDRSLRLDPGNSMPLERLVAFFSHNGYQRTDTVREAGEFAVRGGIVDLFPSGQGSPLRLDFFGDTLEGIRSFDPLTQRSTGTVAAVDLKPMSEVLLDDDTRERFRTRYREQFGTVADDDPLYESLSAGRRYIGMEHWLPLYYQSLETVFDYLPGAAVTLDYQAEDVRDTRLATIADFYAARKNMPLAARGIAPVYRPVRPKQLYLDDKEWDAALASRAVAQLTPFVAPEGSAATFDAAARPGPSFAEARADPKVNVFDALRETIAAEQKAENRVIVAAFSAGSADRLKTVLRDHGAADVELAASWGDLATLAPRTVGLVVLGLERGYRVDDLVLISEQDILGDRLARPPRRRQNFDKFIAEVSNLSPGDLVVHADHGIGRYDGLVTLEVDRAAHDCLRVIYAGDDKLFVPVENIEVLSRFGSEETSVQLDKLGGVAWQSRKARVKQRIREIAQDLIAVAAERQLRQGEALPAPEGLYEEFATRFPYPETEDQLRAIEESLTDLASGKPMDRLICGDVGFGKTEVALRAAFVAALSGMQVAVVVPTTLLARQHARTFTQRFAGLPVRIGQLSRLVSAKDAADVRRDLADGRIDIVVGTHAILGKGVHFKHLGLLVIDEEQHFGVKQKERLKRLKSNVHVLTLTATPIPRTLQLALSGVREMSIIATPPVDRLAVRTFVMPYDGVVIREAIMREHHRGGQSFYVVPRISDIAEVRDLLTQIVPEIRIGVAHGQMAATELESVMNEFDAGSFEILLSTNIIESGLDIPAANTMIIHRADMFGLAQLYQLRGRVGRGKTRAYAYLTLPTGKTLSATAQRRLEVMQTLDTLGAGFTLASHDLDIRGAGNLLGEEQSGHVREVGIELYQHLLEEAVAAARSTGDGAGEAAEDWTPQIAVGTAVLIPESYVADLGIRLGLYRRIATLLDRREIDGFAAELVDRFGPLPPEVENLLEIIAIKRLCRDAGIEKVEAGPKGAVLTFRNNSFANPAGLLDFIRQQVGTAKLRSDHKLVVIRGWEDAKGRVAGVNRLLQALAKSAASGAGEAGLPPPSSELVKRPGKTR